MNTTPPKNHDDKQQPQIGHPTSPGALHDDSAIHIADQQPGAPPMGMHPPQLGGFDQPMVKPGTGDGQQREAPIG